jgi:hypothetical protein
VALDRFHSASLSFVSASLALCSHADSLILSLALVAQHLTLSRWLPSTLFTFLLVAQRLSEPLHMVLSAVDATPQATSRLVLARQLLTSLMSTISVELSQNQQTGVQQNTLQDRDTELS